jgi:hypothetical protein
MNGNPVIVLTTKGHKSGKIRKIPSATTTGPPPA